MRYTDWNQATGYRNPTEYIQNKLGIFTPQYHLRNIETQLLQQIKDLLPEGYELHGLVIHQNPDAPHPLCYLNKKGDFSLPQLLEDIDFWNIADNNEKQNGCQNAPAT